MDGGKAVSFVTNNPTERMLLLDVKPAWEIGSRAPDVPESFFVTWNLNARTREVSPEDLRALAEYLDEQLRTVKR